MFVSFLYKSLQKKLTFLQPTILDTQCHKKDPFEISLNQIGWLKN